MNTPTRVPYTLACRRALLLALPASLLGAGCASTKRSTSASATSLPGAAPATPAASLGRPTTGLSTSPSTATPPLAVKTNLTSNGASRARNWTGRLSLRIDNDPPQAYHAGFELRGHAAQGDLLLFSPLGSTLMQISWTPNDAIWRGNNQVQHYSSLDSLVALALGAPIPVRTLFDWLQGNNTTAPGWRTDMSRLADGRLVVQRFDPAPEVELRLAVDR